MDLLKEAGKTSSEEDINLVAALFEKHTEGIYAHKWFRGDDGQLSFGFYYMFLELTKHEADPIVFFQIRQYQNDTPRILRLIKKKGCGDLKDCGAGRCFWANNCFEVW